MFSRSACLDVSCFMFKEIENKRLGTMITSKINHKEVKRVVIVLVDDGYYCTSRVENEEKIQEIINYYVAMYEPTRGKVQKEKVMMCDWKCKNNNAVKFRMNAKINEKKIKIIEVKNSVKPLGVCETPSLNWRDEFEYVK